MLSLVWPALRFLQLQGSPAELPYRPAWLLGLAAMDVALTMLLYRLLSAPGMWAPTIAAPLLHMATVAGVLWLRSRQARFVQTMTALLSIWVLLGLLLLPPVLVLSGLGVKLGAVMAGNEFASADTAGNFLRLLLVSLQLWGVIAEANVLKHAVDLPLAATLAIALALLIGEQQLLVMLLPVAAATAS